MVRKRVQLFLIFILLFMSIPHVAIGQESNSGVSLPQNAAQRTALVDAVMCEKIKDNKPYNEAVVFSKTMGEAVCFTAFDFISESSFIYHKWFFKDVLNRTTKLMVNPPRWSTYSSIHVRDGDKGPWHVEIMDEQGNILNILRFSIVE